MISGGDGVAIFHIGGEPGYAQAMSGGELIAGNHIGETVTAPVDLTGGGFVGLPDNGGGGVGDVDGVGSGDKDGR